MKKKMLFVVLIIFLLTLSACDSDGGLSNYNVLRGTVYLEGNSSQRIKNAEIYIDNSFSPVATTNSEGQFEITGLEKNTYYNLEVRKENFLDYGRTVSIADSPLTVRLELENSSQTYISGQVNLSNKTGYNQNYFMNDLSSGQNVQRLSGEGKTEYTADEVIVKYSQQSQMQALSSDPVISMLQNTAEITNNYGKTVKYKIREGKSVEEMVAYLEKQPGIEYAEPNYKIYAQAQPNDQYYQDYQWNLVNANLEAAWDLERYSESVAVAVIDSGVLPGHPDLENNLLSGANFVGDNNNDNPANFSPTNYDVTDRTTEADGGSHGTMVAGIIAAETNNLEGIAGVSWGVDIIPIKALDAASGNTFDVAESIYYAIDRGADIINISLGNSADATHLKEAVQTAAGEGIIIIAAAGNHGGSVYYPAAYPEVIAVGAHGKNYQLTDYSAAGANLDLTAPGGDNNQIYSTWGYYENGTAVTERNGSGIIGYGTGTSQAAAHVSGTAALLIESGVSAYNVRSRLLNYTNTMFAGYDSSRQGNGALDAYAALLGRDLGPVRVYLSKDKNRTGTPVAEVDADGEFEIVEDIESGYYYLTAHRNSGDNYNSQTGDYFGASEEIYLRNGGYYSNLEIDMYYVTD